MLQLKIAGWAILPSGSIKRHGRECHSANPSVAGMQSSSIVSLLESIGGCFGFPLVSPEDLESPVYPHTPTSHAKIWQWELMSKQYPAR